MLEFLAVPLILVAVFGSVWFHDWIIRPSTIPVAVVYDIETDEFSVVTEQLAWWSSKRGQPILPMYTDVNGRRATGMIFRFENLPEIDVPIEELTDWEKSEGLSDDRYNWRTPVRLAVDDSGEWTLERSPKRHKRVSMARSEKISLQIQQTPVGLGTLENYSIKCAVPTAQVYTCGYGMNYGASTGMLDSLIYRVRGLFSSSRNNPRTMARYIQINAGRPSLPIRQTNAFLRMVGIK